MCVRLSKNKALYTTLLACWTATFVSIILISIILTGRPGARLGYAVFISTVPTLVTWSLARLTTKLTTRKNVGVVYLVSLLLTVLIQGLAR